MPKLRRTLHASQQVDIAHNRQMNVELKPAFGYLRRSEEDKTGNSFAAQREAIERKAAEKGLKIVQWFEDEHSSFRYSSRRQGIDRLFDALEHNPHIRDVVVEQRSRLGRNLDHLGYVRHRLNEEFRARIHYALNDHDLNTPSGVLMDSVETGLSHVESMRTAENTHSRMKANFRQRDPETGYILRNGGRPQYGYRVQKVKMNNTKNGHTTERSIWLLHEEQAEIFRYIVVELYIGRRYGFMQIVDWLNERGIPSSTGKKWGKSSIHELLRPDRLRVATGWACWNRENVKDTVLRRETGKFKPVEEWIWVENAHPAILTPEEADAAIKILETRGPWGGVSRTDESPYLFSGDNWNGETLFTCKRCGGHVRGRQKGKDQKFYGCQNAITQGKFGECGSLFLTGKDFLEKYVVDTIIQRYSSDEFVKAVLENVNAAIEDANRNGSDDLKHLDKVIAKQRKVFQNLIETVKLTGPSIALAQELRAAEQEIKNLEDKRIRLAHELQPIEPIDIKYLTALLDDLASVMKYGTNKQKREMIRAFVAKMELDTVTRQIDVYLWPSPLLDSDDYIKKSKHIFLCFDRVKSIGGGDGNRTRVRRSRYMHIYGRRPSTTVPATRGRSRWCTGKFAMVSPVPREQRHRLACSGDVTRRAQATRHVTVSRD